MDEHLKNFCDMSQELNSLLKLVVTQVAISQQVVDTHMPRIMQLLGELKVMKGGI